MERTSDWPWLLIPRWCGENVLWNILHNQHAVGVQHIQGWDKWDIHPSIWMLRSEMIIMVSHIVDPWFPHTGMIYHMETIRLAMRKENPQNQFLGVCYQTLHMRWPSACFLRRTGKLIASTCNGSWFTDIWYVVFSFHNQHNQVILLYALISAHANPD